MRCEDKCALATMVCIDCGVCSAHAFFGPGSAGECMACTADRIRKGQEKRMSKSLSPPEVVQALLDGKTVQRSGVTEMRWRGVTLEHRRKPAAVWVPSDATLDGFLYSICNDVWYIVPTTYDWTEARRRNSDIAVRSQQSGRVVAARMMPTTTLYGCEIDAPWEDA